MHCSSLQLSRGIRLSNLLVSSRASVALGLLLVATVPATALSLGAAQSSTQPSHQTPATSSTAAPADKPVPAPTPATPDKPLTPEEARQAQLVADTARLLQLAEELKAEVAKSSKDTLSLSVIKKANEVEKLAKSLKERMKD
jgi:hypothetical protein